MKIVDIAWIYSNTGFHTNFSYKSLEVIALNGKLFQETLTTCIF